MRDRRTIPTLDTRGDSLTGVNWVNGTSRCGLESSEEVMAVVGKRMESSAGLDNGIRQTYFQRTQQDEGFVGQQRSRWEGGESWVLKRKWRVKSTKKAGMTVPRIKGADARS